MKVLQSDVSITYQEDDSDNLELSDNEKLELKVGQHVIVKYQEKYYPGKF